MQRWNIFKFFFGLIIWGRLARLRGLTIDCCAKDSKKLFILSFQVPVSVNQNCDISAIHLCKLRYFHLTLRFICCWYQNKKVPTHNLVPLLDIWPQSVPLSSTFDKIHVFHTFSTKEAVYFTERCSLFAVQRNYNSVKYMIA